MNEKARLKEAPEETWQPNAVLERGSKINKTVALLEQPE